MVNETGDAAAPVPERLTFLRRVIAYFPGGQVLRYVLVGGFNTCFGYGVFALLNWIFFRHHVPASYIFASIFASIISITVAFLGYKWFVFRTEGHYLREWLKAFAVYGTGTLPGLFLLPLLVHLLVHITRLGNKAPYVANAILTGFMVLYSFIGHKEVTFRRR